MANLYEKEISRWEGEGGLPGETDAVASFRSNTARHCSWEGRGTWLKALAIAGVAALVVYALSSKTSSEH